MLGHGQAQLTLGRYLRSSVGDELNPEEAREWLERAVARGVADAQHDLAALSPSPPQSDAECNLGSLPLGKPARATSKGIILCLRRGRLFFRDLAKCELPIWDQERMTQYSP